MSIADNIKQLRKQNHITQKQLAEKSGLAVITIQQYEAGKFSPKPDAVMKLCFGLNCKVTDIIDDNTEKYYRMFDREKNDDYDHSYSYASSEEELNKYHKQRKEAIPEKVPKAFILENGKKIEPNEPVKFTTSSRSHAQTEAYELFHSLLDKDWIMSQEQETTAIQLREILGAYDRLNDNGRKEAVKRVDELTEIPRYTNPDEPPEDYQKEPEE